jgi:hypothetical protein
MCWTDNLFMVLRWKSERSEAIVEKAAPCTKACIFNALLNVGTSRTKKAALSLAHAGPHTYAAVQRKLIMAKTSEYLHAATHQDLHMAQPGEGFLLHWRDHCAAVQTCEGGRLMISDSCYANKVQMSITLFKEIVDAFCSPAASHACCLFKLRRGAYNPGPFHDSLYLCAGAPPTNFQDTCLIEAFQNLGIPVCIDRPGPHRILKDGNALIHPFGECAIPVPRATVSSSGRFVVFEPRNRQGHFCALLSMGSCGVRFDGAFREDVDSAWLTNLINDKAKKVYRVQAISETLFLRGSWTPPWYDSFDVEGGAGRAKPAKKRFTSSAKRGKYRMYAKVTKLSKKKWSAKYKSTPYVRHGVKAVTPLQRANWTWSLNRIDQMTEGMLVKELTKDGFLCKWSEHKCPHCKIGKVRPLMAPKQGRSWCYRCARKGCQKFISPHSHHPVLATGWGCAHKGLKEQIKVLFGLVLGLTNAQCHLMWKSVNRLSVPCQ